MRNALLLGVAAAVIGAGGSASADVNAPSPTASACFYECKKGKDGWKEVTTLMVANPTETALENIVIFFDGNEQAVGFTSTFLTPFDLDEINVCRTLEAAELEVPQAGLITVLPFPVPVAAAASEEDTVLVEEPTVWVKNLLGKFKKWDDEPFAGDVRGIAKAECQEAPFALPEEPPYLAPVLVEDTFDELDANLAVPSWPGQE